MQTEVLKLKQASAVLGASRKDVQNLIQFGVIKPKRRGGLATFDANGLIEAKIALYLKKALGAQTDRLSEFVSVLSNQMTTFARIRPEFIMFTVKPLPEETTVEVRIPFRKLDEQVRWKMRRISLYRDLPRGRKRPGWKREFRAALRQAARDLGPISDAEAVEAVRAYRSQKRKPEITVAPETVPAAAAANCS